jgi:hypothetical protein
MATGIDKGKWTQVSVVKDWRFTSSDALDKR